MKKFCICVFLFLIISACVSLPLHQGGQRIDNYGVSLIPPTSDSWSVLNRSTYQLTLAKDGDKRHKESFILSTSLFKLPTLDTPELFLDHIKKIRTAGPKTDRFESSTDELVLASERTETCVTFIETTKDYGAKNKGAFDYLITKSYGMYCMHPANKIVGVLIALSNRSTPNNPNPYLESQGQELLRSVQFTEL